MKNLLKIMTVGVGLLASAGVLSAQDVRININGASAYRFASIQAIVDVMGGTANCAIGHSGTAATLAGAQGAKNAILRGTITGSDSTDYDVLIKCTWSGSAKGMECASDGIQEDFLTDAMCPSTPGTIWANKSTKAKENTEVAFSDVEQSAALFAGSNELAAEKVGVIPFRFIVSQNAPTAMTNVSANNAQANWIYGNGKASAMLYTGNWADRNTKIYSTGRDFDSGTRTTTLAETGIGVATVLQQYQIAGTGTPALFPVTTINGHPVVQGDGGYASGGTMATALQGVGATDPNVFMGYLSVGDCLNASPARALSYNGVTFSKDNVIYGPYSFWNYEFLMWNADLVDDSELAVLDTIKAQVLTQGSDANGKWIKLTDMKALRNGVGLPVVY
jgi:hypothetical protein